MDDNRPEFQRMIERACDDDHPFDVIVVHSFSCFFRDAFGLEMYMDKLDQLATEHVAERILLPERLEALLQSVADRRLKADAEVQGRIEDLRREAGATEDKLRRLYELVEDGLTDLDDMLKERITALKSDRDRAKSTLERITNRDVAGRLDPDRIARFGQFMRTNITEGTVPFRKAYLRSLIDAVEVDDHVIRIHGSKTVLERAVLADRATHPGVRGFVRKWRAQGQIGVFLPAYGPLAMGQCAQIPHLGSPAAF